MRPTADAAGGVVLELAGEKRYPPALVGQVRERPPLDRRGGGAFDRAQRMGQVVLAELGVERCERLLPDKRDPHVQQRQGAQSDQRARQQARREAARARTAARRHSVQRRLFAGWAGADGHVGHG